MPFESAGWPLAQAVCPAAFATARVEPRETLRGGVGPEVALRVEVGDGKGEQAGRKDVLEFLRVPGDSRRMDSIDKI